MRTKGNALRIRIYEFEDRSDVLELHRLGLQSTGAWIKRGRWDRDLDDIENIYLHNGTFLIGEIGGKIIAMGALKRVSKHTAEMKRLRIAPEFQRRGYGQIMLTRLEEKARDLGYDKVTLDTTIKQAGAQALFLKNGYKEVKRKRIKTANIDTYLIYYKKSLT